VCAIFSSRSALFRSIELKIFSALRTNCLLRGSNARNIPPSQGPEGGGRRPGGWAGRYTGKLLRRTETSRAVVHQVDDVVLTARVVNLMDAAVVLRVCCRLSAAVSDSWRRCAGVAISADAGQSAVYQWQVWALNLRYASRLLLIPTIVSTTGLRLAVSLEILCVLA